MIKNIDSLFKRFWTSKDGNFAIMTAVLLSIIALVVAVGVDSTRLLQASTKLKALTDAAALAATEGQNRSLDERKAIFEQMMQTGLANSPELSGYEYELTYQSDGDGAVLNVTSSSEAQLFFPMTRGEGRSVGANSEVTVGKEQIEVALVLDISSSMEGNKIIELQASATNFIQTLMGNGDIQGRVAISIIPFGGSVRLPSELEFLLDTPAPTQHWDGGLWNGCVSAPPADYNTGITPQHRLDYMPDFTAYQQGNIWCPRAGNEMLGLSQNQNTLTDKIADLTLSDGTGMDIGVAWGLATLDTRWRGQFPGVFGGSPRDFNGRTKKIMIVMTDGKITGQRFPNNTQLTTQVPPYQTTNADYILTQDQANAGYEALCDQTKSKGIEVYTIGFELNQQAAINRLQYCGTSTSHNYVSDMGELDAAFESIAATIATLRLSN